jgi:integrase
LNYCNPDLKEEDGCNKRFARSELILQLALNHREKLVPDLPTSTSLRMTMFASSPRMTKTGSSRRKRAKSGRQRVEGSFEDLLDRAGIKDFRFHDLRHRFASWYVYARRKMHVFGYR